MLPLGLEHIYSPVLIGPDDVGDLPNRARYTPRLLNAASSSTT